MSSHGFSALLELTAPDGNISGMGELPEGLLQTFRAEHVENNLQSRTHTKPSALWSSAGGQAVTSCRPAVTRTTRGTAGCVNEMRWKRGQWQPWGSGRGSQAADGGMRAARVGTECLHGVGYLWQEND